MPPRVLTEKKKLPNLSVSIEQNFADDYKQLCYNNSSTPSREIRNFILKELKKEEKKNESK